MGRYMLIVKGSADSETGTMPSTQELTDMGTFNSELVDAGVLEAGEGLLSSENGVRVTYNGAERSVTPGPFADPESLVAGFWVLNVADVDTAVEWARKIPFRGGEVEVRKVASAEDFGAEFTPELQEHEEKLREQIEAQ